MPRAHVRIRLSNSDQLAIVDADDAPMVKRFRWHLSKRGYVCATAGGRKAYLHRFVMTKELALAPPRTQVDHRNTNKLDCRRSNLRVADNSQNNCNVGPDRANNNSGFKGVHWHKPSQTWRARIGHRGRKHTLGYFKTPEAAAAAYAAAANEMHGPFARFV